MMIPEAKDIPACARIYQAAYRAEPWEEVYEADEVENYITEYLNSDVKCCFALAEGDRVRGVALGLIVPSIGRPYFRIEDICVDPEVHRRGYGSRFMKLLEKRAAEFGCDAILLGTQRGYPSHEFYVKNGFQEVESVLLCKEIG